MDHADRAQLSLRSPYVVLLQSDYFDCSDYCKVSGVKSFTSKGKAKGGGNALSENEAAPSMQTCSLR
jgi:hypothetical protein